MEWTVKLSVKVFGNSETLFALVSDKASCITLYVFV
jgi:hypothetical protein